MTKPGHLESAEIGLSASLPEGEATRTAPEPDSPFRILLFGDFSGRSSRGSSDPDSLGFDRLPFRVDRDNLDEAMDALAIELRLQLEGGSSPTITLRPRALDDLHPGRIYETTAAFSSLRRLRENLQDSSTYADAAAEVRSWGSLRPAEPGSEPIEPPATSRSTSENLVAEMLESAQKRDRESTGTASLNSFVQMIVRPHLSPLESGDREQYTRTVEAAIAAWMRTILHDPDFQALEAAWRGVDFLVRRLETDSQLQIFLLDVSKAELAADLRSADVLAATALHKLLVEETVRTPGADTWSVVAGLYTFDQTLEDVALLGRLGKVARAAGAPFLAGASPRIVGCDSLVRTPDPDDWTLTDETGTELWNALRDLPEASSLGLALPRFLLRLPYGKDTDPVELFAFEEFDDDRGHEAYLWGNAAVACACLIGEQFSEYGWHLKPSASRDLKDLPLHTRRDQGQLHNQPCAEVLLSDRAVERILGAGLMPMVSTKDRDIVRLMRFQSIGKAALELFGPWR